MAKYSDLEFIEAVQTSVTVREVLGKIGLVPAGGNYNGFKNNVQRLGLDTSHFKGKSWSKGLKLGPVRTELDDFLTNKKPIQSFTLRKYLLREGMLEYKCKECNIVEWQDKPISLELDHVDGNPKNNNLSNLRLLCPNCHSQTETFRNKKRKPQI